MAATPQPTSSIPPLAWAEVLTRVRQALERAEREASQRERGQALPAGAAEQDAARETAWQQGLQRLEQHMRRLCDPIRHAERETVAAEADWQGGEEAVKQWLGASAQLGRGLASWADRPPSPQPLSAEAGARGFRKGL